MLLSLRFAKLAVSNGGMKTPRERANSIIHKNQNWFASCASGGGTNKGFGTGPSEIRRCTMHPLYHPHASTFIITRLLFLSPYCSHSDYFYIGIRMTRREVSQLPVIISEKKPLWTENVKNVKLKITRWLEVVQIIPSKVFDRARRGICHLIFVAKGSIKVSNAAVVSSCFSHEWTCV